MGLAPGTMLGFYEILAQVGAGGMGEVYRARDTRLGRDVAIKILPRELAADKERLSRFETEARLASALNHPNIVTIHDIGQAGSTPYIAMEFVDGGTLRELLVSGPLSTEQTLEVATQIADGLAKAHGAAIVHRDLKPENVMITKDGFVKILDFGLSKLVAPASEYGSDLTTIEVAGGTRTSPGTILGTVQYMSPEQAAGRKVDYRSDQFSFGSVLYEMATGKPAFRRTTAVQTMSAIIEAEPEPISALNPKVPEPLRWIVERCLAKEPDKRYASTQDLAQELRSVASHLSAPRGTAPTALPSRSRIWPASLNAFAIVISLATAAALVLTVAPSVRQPMLRRLGIVAVIPQQKNLVVLPFRAIGGGPQNEALSQGLTETLTTKLTRLTTLPSLQVAPASEVREQQINSPEKARNNLGANLVLMGILEYSGASVRVNCTLVDTATRQQLRSRTLTISASDPFAMEDQVVEAAVQMLELELKPLERQALTTHDTQVAGADAFYLQGRGYLQNFDKPENIDNAISVFNRAFTFDPNYALAYAGLGEAYWRKYESSKDTQWIDRAQAACEKALALNPNRAAGHTCLGTLHNGKGRYEEASAEFQRALESEPTSDEAYAGLGYAEEKLGRIEEAEKTYRRAVALRPHYWSNYNQLGHFYFNRARYAEAAEMFAQVVALAPDSFRGYGNLGGTYAQQGRYAEAIPTLERSVAIRPSATTYTNLGTAYFYRGRFSEAARTMEEAVELGETNYVYWGNLADAYYWAPKERDRAAGAYRKAIALARERLKVNARDVIILSDVAVYYAMLGEKAGAQEFLEQALRLASLDPDVQFRAALVHNQSGNVDQTLESLQKAVDAGYSVTVVRDTPNFNKLWANPRFQELLRRQ